MGALTDTKVRGIKATGKAFKLSDGEQLYLHVSATGGRSWRMNYQFGRNAQGKLIQKTLTIGPYPAISLKDAREARDMAKSMLAKGIEPKPSDLFRRGDLDPALRMTFEKMGRDWAALQSKRWSKVYAKNVLGRLEEDVFPSIGERPIADITAAEVFNVLSRIVDRGAVETAHRVCQRISAIFIHAIAKGEADSDPAASWPLPCQRRPRRNRNRPSPICMICGSF